MLLIQEVDALFDKDFYRNFSHPILKLYHPTISELIDYIWLNRKRIQDLRIEWTSQYENVMNQITIIPSVLTFSEDLGQYFKIESEADYDIAIANKIKEKR